MRRAGRGVRCAWIAGCAALALGCQESTPEPPADAPGSGGTASDPSGESAGEAAEDGATTETGGSGAGRDTAVTPSEEAAAGAPGARTSVDSSTTTGTSSGVETHPASGGTSPAPQTDSAASTSTGAVSGNGGAGGGGGATSNGAGGEGGAVTEVGVVDECLPYAGDRPRDWVESLEPPPDVSAARFIEGARLSMIGDWWGVATTPWVPDYAVSFRFADDGHYSARCIDQEPADCPCRALYYGTDLDDPLKVWSLDTTDGVTTNGLIDIIYWYPPDAAYESGHQGYLVDVELDATGDRLRFDLMYDEYGPIHYELERR